MTGELFLLVSAACINNIGSSMCNKSTEAYLKQNQYWDYGSKFGRWANGEYGKLLTSTIAASYGIYKNKKLSFTTFGETRYTFSAGQEDGYFGIIIRIP